jgi:predicted transcriptional regulator
MAKRNALESIFEALGNDRRRRILELVHQKPRTAAEIAKEFDVSWPAISRHMKLLQEAGLIAADEGPRRFTIEKSALSQASAWISRLSR